MASESTDETTDPSFESYPKYVRFRTLRPDGFVEFVFSIGDADLGVELILPKAAYEEFCQTHQVIQVTPAQAAWIDADATKWRYGYANLND